MDILAIDPGRTTGIAIKIADNYNTCTMTERKDITTLITSHRWDVVIYERFISMGNISSHGIFTIELVGSIQAICEEHNLNAVAHTAQKRTPFIEAAKKKTSSKVSHEVDAMAHLVAWEYFNASKTKTLSS